LTKRLLPPPVLCFSISKTQSFPGSGSRQSDSNNFLIPLILRKTSSSKNFAAPKSQLHFLLGQVKRIISSRDISAHPITMGISMSGTFINSKRLKNVFLLLLMWARRRAKDYLWSSYIDCGFRGGSEGVPGGFRSPNCHFNILFIVCVCLCNLARSQLSLAYANAGRTSSGISIHWKKIMVTMGYFRMVLKIQSCL